MSCGNPTYKENFENVFDSKYMEILNKLRDKYSTPSSELTVSDISSHGDTQNAELVLLGVPVKSVLRCTFRLTLIVGVIFLLILLLFRIMNILKNKIPSTTLGISRAHVRQEAPASFQDDLEEINPTNIIPQTDETSIVLFHAPWCSHCKELKPHFRKVAADTYPSNPKVTFKMVNSDVLENSPYVEKLNIRGYPTIHVFKNGQVVETMVGNQGLKALQDMLAKYLR